LRLLRPESCLNAVKQPLEPTDQLGLGKADLDSLDVPSIGRVSVSSSFCRSSDKPSFSVVNALS